MRVQPMLQGSEQDHGGVVDAGDLSKIYRDRAVPPTYQKVDRTAEHVERLTIKYASGLNDPRGHVRPSTEPGPGVFFGDSHFLFRSRYSPCDATTVAVLQFSLHR